MTTFDPTDLVAGVSGADGEHVHRSTLREHARQLQVRALALPLWALLAREAGWWVIIAAAVVLEHPLVTSTLALVMPSAGDRALAIAALAYLAVYVALWHAVGHRIAEARQLYLASSSSGTARRLNPAFGALGVVLLTVSVLALLGVAVRRALSLADKAGSRAVTTLLDTSIDPPSIEQQNLTREQAWGQTFWPDLMFTISVMALLAALAVWIGFTAAPRHQSLSLHLSRRAAHAAAARAAAAAAAHAGAERRVAARQDSMQDRDVQAAALLDVLDARFDRAKTTVRHHLSYRQGRPEATTALADEPSTRR